MKVTIFPLIPSDFKMVKTTICILVISFLHLIYAMKSDNCIVSVAEHPLVQALPSTTSSIDDTLGKGIASNQVVPITHTPEVAIINSLVPSNVGELAGKQCFLGTSNSECTLMLLKPDALHRGLAGEIISRVERAGFKMVATQIWAPTRKMVSLHYSHLSDKPFFPSLLEYLTSGQVMAIVWRGTSVIERLRVLAGDTDPIKANPGTIRGDFANSVDANLIHSSDAVETAQREIKLWGLW